MKFSIVTPVYNGAPFIAETLESVLAQKGDFDIEYVVRDGGSTDSTMDIVRTYEPRFSAVGIKFRAISEKDAGMYDAVVKGFEEMDGDIMAYINADDRYLPGAFATVASIFNQYPDIKWVKGINKVCDERGELLSEGTWRLYRQDWLKKGVYGRGAYFVEQESVFWKRSIWSAATPRISGFRLAGDYALWISFAHIAPLWSFKRAVSIFRRHSKQLSTSMKEYREEQSRIAPKDFFLEKRAVFFFAMVRSLNLDPRRAPARLLYITLFPLSREQWYIDFSADERPFKRKSSSYIA